MWGSFGISIDLPKLEDSDLTMEATLKTGPEMEVTPNLLCYWDLKLLAWHVGIFWDQYWFAKTRGLRYHHHACHNGMNFQFWYEFHTFGWKVVWKWYDFLPEVWNLKIFCLLCYIWCTKAIGLPLKVKTTSSNLKLLA